MTQLQHRWKADFEAQTGVPSEALLRPVAGPTPVGDDLRADPVYRELRCAREHDDASLPLGPWEHELKRADWPAVQRLTTRLLSERSKDLQLAVWLLEAQIQLHGFQGIAPTVQLITQLCARYWPDLHPAITEGDMEHRINVLLAANKLLAPAIRLLPLAVVDGEALDWATYLMAQRHAQLNDGAGDPGEPRGRGLDDYRRRLGRVPAEGLAAVHAQVGDALASLQALHAELVRVCADEAPSFSPLTEVLREIDQFLVGELTQRGYSSMGDDDPSGPDPAAEGDAAVGEQTGQPLTAGASHPYQPWRPSGACGVDPANERMMAYAALDELAEVLLRVDPHSPTPYLLRRAVSWGALSTAELYQEIFVRCGGRLSIFELMGIEQEG